MKAKKGVIIYVEGETEKDNVKEMQKQFKKANKLYIKGKKTDRFIESLNINLIMSHICNEIKPLCKTLVIQCNLDKCNI